MNPDVFKERPIPDSLRPYFRRILVGEALAPIQMEVEPRATGYCYLGWVPRGRWRGWVNDELVFDSAKDGRFHLSGQIEEARIKVRFEGPLWQTFAEFTAIGQYQFLGIPGIDTLNRAVGPQSLTSDCFNAIGTTLQNSGGDYRNTDELHRCFLQALESVPVKQIGVPDYLCEAIKLIEQIDGFCKIADIAESVDVSERQLRREFIKLVGLKPKTFCNVLQVNTALAHLLSMDQSKLAVLAADCGFADQAHMTNAFQKFLGASPMSLATSAETTLSRFVGHSRSKAGAVVHE